MKVQSLKRSASMQHLVQITLPSPPLTNNSNHPVDDDEKSIASVPAVLHSSRRWKRHSNHCSTTEPFHSNNNTNNNNVRGFDANISMRSLDPNATTSCSLKSIRRKDQTIQSLAELREVDRQTIEELRNQVHELRVQNKSLKDWYKFKFEATERENVELKKKLGDMEEKANTDSNEQMESLVKVVVEAAPENIDREYVEKIHRKLGRALKLMTEKDETIKELKEAATNSSESYKKEIKEALENKRRAEMELKEHIAELEKENLAMAEHHAAQWKECHENLKFWKSLSESSKHLDTDATTSDEPDLEESLSSLSINRALTHNNHNHNNNNDWSLENTRPANSASHYPGDVSVETEDAVQMELRAKDDRIAQLQEELYKNERLVMKWKMDSGEAIMAEMMGCTYVDILNEDEGR